MELLLEPHRLDPGSLEYLLEECAEHGQDAPVEVACRALRAPSLEPDQLSNIGDFVRRASSEEPVRRRFVAAASKRGRCPRPRKAWMRRQLEAVGAEKQRRTERPRRQRSVAELDLTDSTWSIDRIPELINRLAGIPRRPDDLTIRLGSFTYASALAILAEWLLANSLFTRYHAECPPEMEQYLERIHFRRALHDRQIEVSEDPMDWAIGLTRINRDLPSHQVTEKIYDIIATFIDLQPEARQALQILIAEMIENVHRHAEAPSDGFAVAQVYPARLKMGIALVDAGMGIRNSLEGALPRAHRGEQRTDRDFLREACRLHVTSKPDRHSGYGLYVLSEVVARNRGTFCLTSGRATLVGYQRKGNVVFDFHDHEPWDGTIVSVIVNLHRDLPILDVYKRMPAPEGYSDDELFQ